MITEATFRYTGVDGLPGNDDQAAMATLLGFHILGLYPGQWHHPA
jgi:putative alpha-1,2-mannosidase